MALRGNIGRNVEKVQTQALEAQWLGVFVPEDFRRVLPLADYRFAGAHWQGCAKGAPPGALAGGTIGSFFGPPGTVIGGGIGGVAGCGGVVGTEVIYGD
jgi:hypothetical protein